jgi:hypothetical protein
LVQVQLEGVYLVMGRCVSKTMSVLSFQFKSLKAAQAASFIINEAGVDKKINISKLIDLLSMSDYQAFTKVGLMITNDIFIIKNNRLVISNVSNRINNLQLDQNWCNHFLIDGNDISTKLSDNSELSDFDIETLKSVIENFYILNEQQKNTLCDFFSKEEKEISYEEVLSSAGWTSDEVQFLFEREKAILSLDRVLQTCAA